MLTCFNGIEGNLSVSEIKRTSIFFKNSACSSTFRISISNISFDNWNLLGTSEKRAQWAWGQQYGLGESIKAKSKGIEKSSNAGKNRG